MPNAINEMTLVLLRCSQELEHRNLRGLIREKTVVAAVEHENGDTDP